VFVVAVDLTDHDTAHVVFLELVFFEASAAGTDQAALGVMGVDVIFAHGALEVLGDRLLLFHVGNITQRGWGQGFGFGTASSSCQYREPSFLCLSALTCSRCMRQVG